MKHATVRWTIHILALCVLGPIAGLLIASLHAPDGGPHATLLLNTQPAVGVLMGLLAFSLAAALAFLAAKLVDARAGLFAAGVVLAWAAARSGRVDVILRAQNTSSPLIMLAVEGLLVGLLGVLIAIGVYAIAKPTEQLPASEPAPFFKVLGAAARRAVRAPGITIALPVAVVAGAAAAWIVATSALKGQAIAAGFVAGIIGGAAGRIADVRTPGQTFMIAIGILAIVAPISALIFQRGVGPVEAAYDATLFALTRVAPLDWVAGGLLGVPLGVAWAGSMIEKRAA